MLKKVLILLNLFTSPFACCQEYPFKQNSIRVLIVGAGLTGLSAAKALQNQGIYPDIIEKEEMIRIEGSGICIPANGSWVLEKLAIPFASKALRISHMQFTDDKGEILIQERIDHIHPEKAQFYCLSRKELMEILQSSLSPETSIQTSVTIKRFIEENDCVTVEFSNESIKSYDLVLGCDGIHSSLRSQVHPDETPQFLNLLVWRTILSFPGNVEMPTYMLGNDRSLLFYPMLNNNVYVYGQLFQTSKEFPSTSFCEIFSHFGGLMPKMLSHINKSDVHFQIHSMEKSHSIRYKLDGFKRILLMGDAAHAMGPALQNGAAQAFEDAYILQELFSDVNSAEKIPSILEMFEKRRMTRVSNIFRMSNTKIQAFSDPQQVQNRNEKIRTEGAPNVNGFKLIMQENP